MFYFSYFLCQQSTEIKKAWNNAISCRSTLWHVDEAFNCFLNRRHVNGYEMVDNGYERWRGVMISDISFGMCNKELGASFSLEKGWKRDFFFYSPRICFQVSNFEVSNALNYKILSLSKISEEWNGWYRSNHAHNYKHFILALASR